jgi:hypothetical protein
MFGEKASYDDTMIFSKLQMADSSGTHADVSKDYPNHFMQTLFVLVLMAAMQRASLLPHDQSQLSVLFADTARNLSDFLGGRNWKDCHEAS